MEIVSGVSLSLLPSTLSSLSSQQLLSIVKECLDTVIAVNFCGLECETITLISSSEWRDILSFGLNSPFHAAKCMDLLVIVHSILCPSSSQPLLSSPLLYFRFLLLWQSMLEEPEERIKDRILTQISILEEENLTREEKIQVQLELFYALLQYYEHENAREALNRALFLSGLEVDLTGKMGKRTRYQVKELAQLVINTRGSSDCSLNEDDDLPINVSNQDDTLLQKVTLTDPSSSSSSLSPIELALILAIPNIEKNFEFNEELLLEKCGAYIEEIVRSRRCWPVQCAALLLRSSIERKSKRRVERASSQTEHIVHLVMNVEEGNRRKDKETKMKRCQFVLASGLVPFWKCQVIHAQILVSLGCISEALLIYESMKEWDRVVECYGRMGQIEKALTLLRELLVERPEDVTVLCSLGDITNKKEYYEKAIEVSFDRCARAHKALGMMYLQKRMHGEGYGHLMRSVQLQPIQLGVWFNAGHCAWKENRYTEAISAYHRCVSLEPEHFEAWNNLAAAYIRVGQKDRALRILQEALKFNFEHANVWENVLLLSVDTQQIRSALLAIDRLAEMKKRVEDDEVIEAIVTQIITISQESERRDMKEFACKTMGHLAASQALTGRMWRAYSKLREGEGDKYITLLEKAVLGMTNKKDWTKDGECVGRALEGAVTLAKERMRSVEGGRESTVNQARGRIRMALRQIITAIDKSEEEVSADNEKILKEGRQILESVTN